MQRPPFAVSSNYNTPLDPGMETFFRQWLSKNNVPFDPNARQSDYDMRGYYRGLMQGNPMAKPTEINANDGRPHYTDYYKTPLHQSFSQGSQWATPATPDWINGHQLAAQNGRIAFDEAPSDFRSKLAEMAPPHQGLFDLLRMK